MVNLFKNTQILVIIALILFCVPVDAAGPKVVDVDFVGLIKTDEGSLRSLITSVEGTPYSSAKINADIKALYQSGFFRDVQVRKQNVAGGVHIVFKVQEKGVIGSIVFRGNRKIKDKAILEAIKIARYNLVDQKKIAESVEAIRELYDKKGYYLAEVTTKVVPYSTEANELELIFSIIESQQVRIKRISFVGNKFFTDRKLRKKIGTKIKGLFSFISGSGKYNKEKLQVDVDRLTYFYLNEGFIKVKVGKPQVSLTRDKKSIYIMFPVHEGPQYTVGDVDVSGQIVTTREEILSKLTLNKGDIYSRMNQDKDVQAITRMYGDQSYAFANVYPQIQTDDESKVANITFIVDKGRKIRVENIIIKGNTITRDKVIRREIQIPENAPYNYSAVELSRARLQQLGFFEEVKIATPRGTTDGTVDLVVEVKEKPTGSFSLGAGFSSLESFIFTAAVQKENFFGYGISGAASANISKLRQEFSLSMTDRYFLDTRWIFSTSVYRFTSALNEDFDQKSFGGSVSFGRELFPFFSVSLGYQVEDVSVTNFSSQVPVFFQRNASGLTSSLVNSIVYDRRDNRLQTTKGFFSSVTSEYAGKGIGGDNDFWKLYADVRGFFPLLKSTVLKARGVFGYVNSLNSDPVPLFERYFLGGINTLRGFDLNSIGPQLRIPKSATSGDTEFTYGGNRIIMFNVEYEVPLYNQAGLRGVIFADAGQSYAENETIDLTAIRANYGVGLRWQSPFGPLRFEWGFPIDRRSGESFSVFNFSIGQSF